MNLRVSACWLAPFVLAMVLLMPFAGGAQGIASGKTGDVLRVARTASAQNSIVAADLELGKSRSVITDFRIGRISVGDPDILDVLMMSDTEVQLVAKSVGTTNVVIWDSEKHPQVAIDASVGVPYSRLAAQVAKLLDSEDISIETVGGSLVLRGSVPDALSAEQAVELVQAGLEGQDSGQVAVVNMLRVRGQQQVMLDVRIAEVSRSLGRKFGANFDALFQSDGQSIHFTNMVGGLAVPRDGGEIGFADAVNMIGTITGFGALESLEVFITALREKGVAKVLAEPTLVARSGETASFLVGGEVPVPIAQGGSLGSITVEYKKFGVGLGFTPTVLSSGRIHIEVRPEVSEPDFSLGTSVSGFVVPGFNTRRASTAVELADGESFAIAGLFRDDLRQISSAYPGLGDIPVFGALFRSSQYEKREIELVFIVTPHLVSPIPDFDYPLATDIFVEPTAIEFYLLGKLEGDRDTAYEVDSREILELSRTQVGACEPEQDLCDAHDVVYSVPSTSEEGAEAKELEVIGPWGFVIPSPDPQESEEDNER